MHEGGDFRSRYGPVAVIAGASEGLGAAFADAVAARGLDVVLLARRADVLDARARELRRKHGVTVHASTLDLGRPEARTELARIATELEVGLAIFNAAHAPIGSFVDQDVESLLQTVDVNVRGPLLLARTFAPEMLARGRGGIVLMSSLAGAQGSPRIATYAATKAFNTVLAEGLWDELRGAGVDVLVSCAGAITTPGYRQTATGTRPVPGTLDADVVAERTLGALGQGPRVTPGLVNRIAAFIVGRLLPRRLAIAIMRASTRDLS